MATREIWKAWNSNLAQLDSYTLDRDDAGAVTSYTWSNGGGAAPTTSGDLSDLRRVNVEFVEGGGSSPSVVVPTAPIHLGGIDSALNHPKYAGHDMAPIDAYEPPTIQTAPIILDSEVSDKFLINTSYITTDLAVETGTVSCLYPDSASAANVTDGAGLISPGDWTAQGEIVNPYGGDDWMFGIWGGPSDPSLENTSDLVVRVLCITLRSGGGDWVPMVKYGTFGVSQDDSEAQADNTLYRLMMDYGDEEMYYSHEIGAGSGEYTQTPGGPGGNHTVSLLSWYRSDNGDGTCDIWCYRDGVRLTSNGSPGGSFSSNGDGTFTGNLPDGGSNGVLSINDVAGGAYDVQHFTGCVHILDQLPADPDAREAAVAANLLNNP